MPPARKITTFHDALFLKTMEVKVAAAAWLEARLPGELASRIDWSTLSFRNETYVDEEMRYGSVDALFDVRYNGDEPLSLYVLVEHQTTVPRLMVLRLLRYCLRIWEREAANLSPEDHLTPIVPVVFHQGRRKWRAETSFEALFPEEVRDWATTPRFTHVLMDQVGISPAEVRGGYRGRIMELSMAMAFGWHVREALPLLRQLLDRLPPEEAPDNYRGFVNNYHYLTGTEDMVDKYKQAVGDIDLSLLDGTNPYDMFLRDGVEQKFGPKLTNALEDARSEGIEEGKELGRSEGVEEGKALGRSEGVEEGMELGRREGANQSLYNTVSTMLAKGADWEVIEAFTSVDEARYRELAREVACIKDPVPD